MQIWRKGKRNCSREPTPRTALKASMTHFPLPVFPYLAVLGYPRFQLLEEYNHFFSLLNYCVLREEALLDCGFIFLNVLLATCYLATWAEFQEFWEVPGSLAPPLLSSPQPPYPTTHHHTICWFQTFCAYLCYEISACAKPRSTGHIAVN